MKICRYNIDIYLHHINYNFFFHKDFVSPVTAAQTLLHSACKKRKEMLQKTMTLLLQIIQEFNQLEKINKKYKIIFFNWGERRRGGGQGGVLIIIWGLLALLR